MVDVRNSLKDSICDSQDLLLNDSLQHIAIIMDGNARWAKQECVSKRVGYEQGIEASLEIVDFCSKLGLQYLTLFAFSSENWDRPSAEINLLMNLFNEYLKKYLKKIQESDVRIVFIGSTRNFAEKTVELMNELMRETKQKKGMMLIIAVGYGSRDEIQRAAEEMVMRSLLLPKEEQQKILYDLRGRNGNGQCCSCSKGGDDDVSDVRGAGNKDDVSDVRRVEDSRDILYTEIATYKDGENKGPSLQINDFLQTFYYNIPDPDLVIRTSGEKRLSNFLLWQIAYSELYFTDVLWPDFNQSHLIDAIKDFNKRVRKYGK